MNNKTKALTIRVSESEYKQIKAAVSKSGLSQSKLIIEAINNYMQDKSNTENNTNEILIEQLNNQIDLLQSQLAKAEAREQAAQNKADYLSLPWLVRVFRGYKSLPTPKNNN